MIRIFKGMIFVFIFIANHAWASGPASPLHILKCVHALTLVTGQTQAPDLVLERASQSSSPSIVDLTQVILKAFGSIDPRFHSQESQGFGWELSQVLVELQDLVELHDAGVSETDIAIVAKPLIEKIEEQIRDHLSVQAQAQNIQREKTALHLRGAEFLEGLADSTRVIPVFVAPSVAGFQKWFSKLGFIEKKLIEKRLQSISQTGYLGDVEIVNKMSHLVHTSLYELRFHAGSAVRIYFIRTGHSIVIVYYGQKSHGQTEQQRDIRRAGEITSTFLSLQAN